MFTHILIPTDETSELTCAVDTVIKIATRHEVNIHALHIVKIASLMGQFDFVVERCEMEDEAAVETVEHQTQGAGVPVQKTFRYGSPFSEILGYAADHGIELIVMGTHGRSGLRRLLSAGNTAERVVREANASVLVVRPAACERTR